MADPGRSAVRRMLLVLVAVLVLAVVVSEPLAEPPGMRVTGAQLTHGLGLRPVLRATEGPCATKPSRTVIWSSELNTCYEVRPEGLQITRLQSAEVAHTETAWWEVDLAFDDEDAAAFRRLTTRLSAEPEPRNELAIVLHGPPGGRLLAAPVVTAPIGNHLALFGGPTEADATALLRAILQ